MHVPVLPAAFARPALRAWSVLTLCQATAGCDASAVRRTVAAPSTAIVVVRTDGLPERDVYVSFTPTIDSQTTVELIQLSRGGPTDSLGAFTLNGVKSGTYKLSVSVSQAVTRRDCQPVDSAYRSPGQGTFQRFVDVSGPAEFLVDFECPMEPIVAAVSRYRALAESSLVAGTLRPGVVVLGPGGVAGDLNRRLPPEVRARSATDVRSIAFVTDAELARVGLYIGAGAAHRRTWTVTLMSTELDKPIARQAFMVDPPPVADPRFGTGVVRRPDDEILAFIMRHIVVPK